jgi:flagellar biogenesis protein FliO
VRLLEDRMKKTLITAVALLGLSTIANPAAADSRKDLLDRLTADLNPAELNSNGVELAAAPIHSTERVAPIRAQAPAPQADRPERADAPAVTAPVRKARTLKSLRERQAKKEANQTTPMGAWLMVGLALLALGGVAWWLKRRAARGTPWAAAANRMETIATHRVTGKHMVSLVRVPGRILVLGLNDKGVNLLTELDENDLDAVRSFTEEGETPALDTASFADRLGQLRDRVKDRRDPFRGALVEEDEAPVDDLLRLDERAAIRERLDALRRRSVA